MADITPGLVLVHSHRPESLRELLVAWTAGHPLAPLESEVALVQSQGVAQWLRLALAADRAEGGQGIAAAWRIELPARFLWGAYRAVLGADAVPARSALDKEALTWRLMRMLPARLALPAYAPLARYLHGDERLIKRHQLARRIADLFDQYQVYRADWLGDWARGVDRLRDWRRGTRPLTAEEAWQADLWRAVIEDVRLAEGHDPLEPSEGAGGEGVGDIGRARIHERFMQVARRAAAGSRPAGLPRRLVVFGISSLPLQSLEALAALARWCQVLVCVYNPSDQYWGDIVADQDLLRTAAGRVLKDAGGSGHDGTGGPDEETTGSGAWMSTLDGAPDAAGDPAARLLRPGLEGTGHPLLAAWGRQGRDYIGLLEALADNVPSGGFADLPAPRRIGLYDEGEEGEGGEGGEDAEDTDGGWADEGRAGPGPVHAQSLLSGLQADIRALRRPEEARRIHAPVDPRTDHSIRFHVAYSELREVEILHDQLLAAFSADPTLDERSIIVMVPDIERYAPLIEAVFNRHAQDDPRRIAYSLHDRAVVSEDPMVAAVSRLLELPRMRFTVAQIRDWLEWPAVQARFDIEPDDLPLYARWLEAAQVRWGLDATQRASLDLPPQADRNTWAFGLRRLLLGYANGGGDGGVDGGATGWQGVEPVAGISGNEAARLGPLIAFIDALGRSWQELSEPATPTVWAGRLINLCGRLLAPVDAAQRFSLQQIEEQFVDWADLCAEVGLDIGLSLDVVREAWLETQSRQPGGQAFLGRGVSFATLMPMRAIPFRRIHLLGMNDADFPRQRPPLDFDLMGQELRPGDRSRREDDRYLFLEALLSAREHLHVSWVGRSAIDGREMPPSVLVAQLRDHLREVWTLPPEDDPSAEVPAGEALLEALTIEHPLQAFSRRYFEAGGGVDGVRGAATTLPSGGLFSHAEDWRAGWAALARGPQAGAGSAAGDAGLSPLPAGARPLVWGFAELTRFLRSPVAHFFRRRLGVEFEGEPEAVDDAERFELNGLERWTLQQDLIADQLVVRAAGGDAAQALDRWVARAERQGVLPAGAPAGPGIEALTEPIDEMFKQWADALVPWSRPLADLSIDLALGAGRCEDTIDALRADADGGVARVVLRAKSFFTSSKHHRFDQLLEDWVIHLAAHCAGQPLTSILIGKNGRARLDPLEPAVAEAAWQALADALAGAMLEPLPFAVRTGQAWVGGGGQVGEDASHPPGDAVADEARRVYEGSGTGRLAREAGERESSPALARAFPDFDALWSAGRFDEWAQRLLGPLNAAIHRAPKGARAAGARAGRTKGGSTSPPSSDAEADA